MALSLFSLRSYVGLFLGISICAFTACTQQPPTAAVPAPATAPTYPISGTLPIHGGIRCILHDSKGNYWLGTDQEGACRFDGRQFVHFTTAQGLSGNQVINIREDADGTIWLGTNKGLSSFRGGELVEVQVPVALPGVAPQWELAAGDIWMGAGSTIDIIRIHNGVASAPPNPNLTAGTRMQDDWGVTDISFSPDGRQLWIASYDGVAGYDGQSWTFIRDSTLHYDGKTDYLHVRSILEDSQGRLWIGNNGSGVLLKEAGRIVNFSKARGLYKGTPTQYPSEPGTLMHVFAIAEDTQGHIWFGDRDTGAWRFDGKRMQHFIVDPALASPHVWDIYEDRKGSLLVAMAAGGVYRFDGQGFVRKF